MANDNARAKPLRWPDATLVLAGHGSSKNSDSARPTFDSAAEIRRRNLFAAVREGFLKQDPQLSEVVASIDTPEVFVVPYTACRGYVTDTLIPKALGLPHALNERIGPKGRQTIHMCDPVGTHPSVAEILCRRVRSLVIANAMDADETAIIVIGHGNDKNPENAIQTRRIAEQMERARLAGSVHCAYLEEPTKVEDWRQLTDAANIIVAPFLIAGGLHGADDVPALIGLDPEDLGLKNLAVGDAAAGPFDVDGRKIWYGRPVGFEPEMADIIISRVTSRLPVER